MANQELSIKTTFKKTPEEIKLYNDITKASTFVGKGSWMKVAAHEKLERDNNVNLPINQNVSATFDSTTLINSPDDLFP